MGCVQSNSTKSSSVKTLSQSTIRQISITKLKSKNVNSPIPSLIKESNERVSIPSRYYPKYFTHYNRKNLTSEVKNNYRGPLTIS